MSKRILSLQRSEYLDSISTIEDTPSRKFADQSLAWWDRHFSWKSQGCDVLIGDDDEHLSYLFSKIDRYGEYLTIYNLFTPLTSRRKGYAKELLEGIILRALKQHIRRITFSSISSSLDFYLSLGFVYWGINDIGDYYCDLPIPENGLNGIERLTSDSTIQMLIGKKIDLISLKVIDKGVGLTSLQTVQIYQDKIKLGNRCRYNDLLKYKKTLLP